MTSKKIKLNNYRHRKIKKRNIITSDHGSWVAFDDKTFDIVKKNKLKKNSEVFKRLYDAGFISDKKNEGKIINALRDRYSFLFQGTSLHIVVPTLRCNLGCVYCHASSVKPSSKGFDMSKETAKKTVDFIFQSPSQYITIEFQGGEPTLNFDIVEYIVRYARQKNLNYNKNLDITIVTNLAAMNDKKLDFLIDNDVGICTSLDGPKDLHDSNRKFLSGKGSYSNTVKQIKKIKKDYAERGVIRKMHALITLTKTSLKSPKKIVDSYLKEGLETIHLRFLNPLGCAKEEWEKIGYSADEFIKFWRAALDYIIRVNKSGKKIQERTVVILLKKIFDKYDPGYLDLRSPCGAAIGQMVYNHNGDIYTCDEGRMLGEDTFLIGNTAKNTYREVLTSNQTCGIIAASTNDVYMCDNCAYKPYCGLCPVCNYAEQGSIITKVPQSDRCKIFMAQFDYVFDKLLNDKKSKDVLMSWISE